jgi:hypothetical protein
MNVEAMPCRKVTATGADIPGRRRRDCNRQMEQHDALSACEQEVENRLD